MSDSDPLSRSMRVTARVIGWFFVAVGLFLAALPVLLKGRNDDGIVVVALLFAMVSFAIGIPFLGLGGFVLRHWKRARARGLVRSLSRTLGDGVAPREDWRSIQWTGSRAGAKVALSWSIDVPTTQVSIEIGGSPGTMRIIPTWSRGGRLIGGRPTPTGHAEFDRHFLARSDPAGLIGDLFAGDRKELLARSLFYLPRGESCRVILTLSDLRIRMPRLVRDPRILERLFDAAENFATAIREAMLEAGYAVLIVGEGSGARCPVCISTLVDEVVVCFRCRTPHHQGCWEYAGECALFACGGRRWVRP